MNRPEEHGQPAALLSLPCRSLWETRQRPAEPDAMLARLPGEVRRLRERGARLVEFHTDACVLDHRYARRGLWERVAEILEGEGLGATVHLPYIWTDLAALDRPAWEGSLRSVETAMAATAPLRPRLAAVHPTNYATQALVAHATETERPPLLAALAGRLVEALRRLAAGPAGPVLALENLEGMPFDLFVRVLDEAGVAACLDIGHAISNGDEPLRALAALAGRLAGLHLHDALPPDPASGRPTGRAHLPLGRGRLDLDGLLRGLASAGFAGPVVLEVEGDEGDQGASAKRFVRAARRLAAGDS